MLQSITLDVNTEQGLKPVEFFYLSAFEYYLGWKKTSIGKLIQDKRFPDTPYIRKIQRYGKELDVRLFTALMVDEVIELVENHYPPYYRGRDPVLKAAYQQEMANYSQKVKELQDRWENTDYISLAPPSPKFKKRKRKIESRDKREEE